MVSIKPEFPPTWVPDDETEECARCHDRFSVLNRKHHCRACGKIFCADCSPHIGSIPSYIHRMVDLIEHKGLRMCTECNTVIKKKKKSKKYIFIFSILPLRIRELEVLLYVNKKWNCAATSVIGMFKSIQYKTGYRKWTGLERRLIDTHWREFGGHNRLMVQVFRGMIGIEHLSKYARHFKCEKPMSSCQDLYCDSRLCKKEFTPYDLLELLYNQHTEHLLDTPEIESWIGVCLTRIHVNWVIKFIPWLFQMGKSPPTQRIITNNIIPMALDNMDLAYAIYFECEMLQHSSLRTYYMAIQSRLMSLLEEDVKDSLRRSHKLLHMFRDPEKLKKHNINVRDIALPYDAHTIIKSVDHANIRQLSSSTRPWIIPVHTNRGYLQILQKTDDLRKDRVVINTMEFLKVIDSRLSFHTYHVFPISNVRGWVEMIPHSKTVYDIQKTSSIQNYIISFNRDMTASDIRHKFLYSCTSNCVLGYMLGLGDRNLHNILVCGDTSTIANIDFSYLLGYDPKFESTEMKITSGMVDMLGGYDSEEFSTLKHLCSSTYSNIRRHTYFWYSLFRYLATADPPIYPHGGDLKGLQEHVNRRLMPNASEEAMKVAIVKSVDSNSDSWKSSLSDMAHSVKTNITGLIFNMDL